MAHTKNIMDRKITISLHSRKLPPTVTAATQEKGRDDYIIILNGDKTGDEQTAGLLHEVLHIWHRDFDSSDPADKTEQIRHAELLRVIKLLEQEAMQI